MARRKNQTAGKAAAPETASKTVEKKELFQTEPMKRAAEELAKVMAEETKMEPLEAAEEPVEKKTAEKPADEPKDTAAKAVKKPATEKKTTEKPSAEKKAVKKQEIKTGISVQYMGKDISDKDMITLVKKDWTDSKHKVGDIKTMELYVKTEENKVYYVINGTETGSVEI